MAIIVLFLYFVPLSLSQTLLLKGDAVRNATAVILTNNRSQAGVGWSRNSIILTPFGFTASFSYRAIAVNGTSRGDGVAFFVNTLNFTIGGAGGNMGIPPNSTGFKINYYGGSQVIFYNPSYTITFNNAFTPDNNWHNCSTSFNCTHAVVSLDGQTPLVAVSPLLDCGMGTIYAGIGGGTGQAFQHHWARDYLTFDAIIPTTTSFVTTSPITTTPVTTSPIIISPITTFQEMASSESPEISSSPEDSKIVPIAVGVSIGVIALIVGAVLLIVLLLRRKKQNETPTEDFAMTNRKETFVSNDQRALFGNSVIKYSSLEMGAKIGEGTYGDVFKAKYMKTEVAVKKLKISTEQDLLHEASVLRQLPAHPNVVLFRGVTLPPDPICIVTEYCAGGSLHTYLQRNKGKLSVVQMVKFASDVAKGMLWLHDGLGSTEIIHRDLAARNILMKNGETCAVSDFGLARTKSQEMDEGSTQAFVGPVKWMAPESLTNRVYSKKSDVFSYGVVLYEIATQEAPWNGVDVLSVIAKVSSGQRMQLPASIPGGLSKVIQACWSQDPAARPTFESILGALEKMRAASTKIEVSKSTDEDYRISPDAESSYLNFNE